MLVRTKITNVRPGVRFYRDGRTYTLATEDERKRHPVREPAKLAGYCIPDRGDRVPASFNPLLEVYIERKDLT